MLRPLLLRAAALLLGPLAAGGLVAFAALRLSGRTVRGSSSAVAFTPAVATGGGLLAVLSLTTGRRGAAAALATSSGALAAVVVPRTRAKPQPLLPPGEPVELRILSANCLKGRADADALVALVREVQPDVLALQEQNRRFMGRLEDAGLFDLFPHRVLSSGGRLADTALLSRHPMQRTAPHLPTVFSAAVATLPDGRRLPLVSFHPLPPVGRDHTGRWLRSMEEVPGPTDDFVGGIVCGDFNATLDHPQFRQLLAAGWRDVAAECGQGLRATWSDLGVLRLTIDHILVSPGVAVRDYRVHRVAGSDHRAISATVAFPPTS